MPPKASKSKSDDNESKVVIEYLQKVNRPLNANDVANSLQGSVPKSSVQKILTSLTNSGEIIGKQYGKQWIYCANQENIEIPSLDEAEEEEARIEELTNQIAELKGSIQTLQAQNNGLKKMMTVEQMHQRIEFLKSENEKNTEHLSRLESGDVISEEEKNKIEQEYKAMLKLWSQRKRIFKDIFDTITENYNDKPKKLMTQLGIETDEDCGVDIKQF
ncbi:hypothetical protein BB559_002889 [Furculomyces boomerangus]|uniref:Homologous-pairing protein 2 homolog n=2 Tax=Harpellales TaxID=61421 RepID=A0A2T9YRD0_9FUNG|nr:hypothetical protein BB559_002889 [Furculomyces boomerangus]PVZ97807.1 hypothetical protein BB558_006234 [Smittium angustum]PVZ98816.1 hypothetical protein BB558_005177 [Smittium angustum]PVZ99763.1 hypothetical protein BB558_004214 [Smittium angustum]